MLKTFCVLTETGEVWARLFVIFNYELTTCYWNLFTWSGKTDFWWNWNLNVISLLSAPTTMVYVVMGFDHFL